MKIADVARDAKDDDDDDDDEGRRRRAMEARENDASDDATPRTGGVRDAAGDAVERRRDGGDGARAGAGGGGDGDGRRRGTTTNATRWTRAIDGSASMRS